ncbi:hypothetical protein G9A89_022341 [Geosiphon pyriformis]|nr:hypothetical protein G9A89_022341 [Geosiphon pyriformis]
MSSANFSKRDTIATVQTRGTKNPLKTKDTTGKNETKKIKKSITAQEVPVKPQLDIDDEEKFTSVAISRPRKSLPKKPEKKCALEMNAITTTYPRNDDLDALFEQVHKVSNENAVITSSKIVKGAITSKESSKTDQSKRRPLAEKSNKQNEHLENSSLKSKEKQEVIKSSVKIPVKDAKFAVGDKAKKKTGKVSTTSKPSSLLTKIDQKLKEHPRVQFKVPSSLQKKPHKNLDFTLNVQSEDLEIVEDLNWHDVRASTPEEGYMIDDEAISSLPNVIKEKSERMNEEIFEKKYFSDAESFSINKRNIHRPLKNSKHDYSKTQTKTKNASSKGSSTENKEKGGHKREEVGKNASNSKNVNDKVSQNDLNDQDSSDDPLTRFEPSESPVLKAKIWMKIEDTQLPITNSDDELRETYDWSHNKTQA